MLENRIEIKGDVVMYLKQSELFDGMNIHFIKKIMDLAEKVSYQKGNILFNTGDPPTYTYILVQGKVKLLIDGSSLKEHIVSQTGEFFGWSGLVGGNAYTASAQCLDSTTLIQIESKRIKKMLEEDIDNGILFYQNLCRALGNRLTRLYCVDQNSISL